MLGPAGHRLTLARLEPTIRFVNHIGTATTADNAIVAMAVFKRLQRVANLHGTISLYLIFLSAAILNGSEGRQSRRGPRVQRPESQAQTVSFAPNASILFQDLP